MTPGITITVGIPVRNGERYLASALQCILSQNDVALKVLISDNCSDDQTPHILNRYSYLDQRIHIYRQSNILSALENFEFLLFKADTEYFCWAAADDLRHPDFLKLLLANIGNRGGAFARYCHYNLLSRDILQEPKLPNLSRFESTRDQLRAYLSEHRAPNLIYGLFRTLPLRDVFKEATRHGQFDMIDVFIVSLFISRYGMSTLLDCPILFYAGQEGKQYQHKSVNGYKLDSSRYDAEILLLACKNLLLKEVAHGLKVALLEDRLPRVVYQLLLSLGKSLFTTL